MKRLIFFCVAFVAFVATVNAQNVQTQSFEKHNQWMLSGRYIAPVGVGVEAIYGRQFTPIVFLGVGFWFRCIFQLRRQILCSLDR